MERPALDAANHSQPVALSGSVEPDAGAPGSTNAWVPVSMAAMPADWGQADRGRPAELEITSPANPRIKQLVSLRRRRSRGAVRRDAGRRAR